MDLVEHEGDFQGEVVSSSWVREALTEGDVAAAAYCLGRPYRLILENNTSTIDNNNSSTSTDGGLLGVGRKLVYMNQPPAVGQYNVLAHVTKPGEAVHHVNYGSTAHVVLGEHGDIEVRDSTMNNSLLNVPLGGMLVLDFLEKC